MRGFIVGAALFGSVGCGFVQIVPAGSAADGEPVAKASQRECASDVGSDSDTPRHLVLARVCKDRHDKARMDELHARFDDRRPDLLSAAVITYEASWHDDRPLVTATAAYYAGLLEPSALTAAVARVDVSSEARAAFVKGALEAKSTIQQRVAKLDVRRKRMYIDAPNAVVAKRQTYFKDHAAAYAKLDALQAQVTQANANKKSPLELAPSLAAVRGEYFAACTSDECRFEPLSIDVTKQLVNVYIAANEPLLAYAEGALLRGHQAESHLFSVETSDAIHKAMLEERNSADLYEKAKRDGADAATLTARFGDPPPLSVEPYSTNRLGRLPDGSRIWSGGERGSEFPSASGVVKSITDSKKPGAHGERLSVVTYRPIVSTEDVESCRETGKVNSVSWDSSNRATLNYETQCKTVGKKTNVDTIMPVLVPTSEVANVKPGETLVAFINDDTRVGVVVQTFTHSFAAKVAAAPAPTKGKKGKKAKAPAPAPDASEPPRTVFLQFRGERIGAK